jgi:DNA mismatch repair protein MutS
VREGGIIQDGYNETVDMLKRAKTDGKSWLIELETKEREATGIKNLKIKFNKVFGYYFDVTNSYKELVPEHFIRKQTLANSERYSSDELEEIAGKILGAEDRLNSLEYDLFVELRETLAKEVKRVQKTAKIIADLDAFASLAYVAEKNHYVRPAINEEGRIHIVEGRHPVVERVLENDSFITNDTLLDNHQNRVSIITGPNMAGKSTYMRQVALIVLMAQIGSFVPATSAEIGIVDRIFTRVGASDDLASGQSTFMVEMSEVANILRNATSNSLLILDEIGRGTSTYDGLSIAWAVVEYISSKDLLGAKTLFATHYHELTELEGKLDSVNNYCISVKESGDDIVFLRKIIKGGADKSYGIQVAKLAGVPEVVLSRAREIADELSQHDITVTAAADIMPKILENTSHNEKSHKGKNKDTAGQMSLFGNAEESSVVADIKALDLSNMTPMKALLYLNDLQERLK